MKILAFVLFAAAALAQPQQPNISNAKLETRPFSGDLAAQIRSGSPAWFGYGVKSVSHDGGSCCWSNNRECGCRLEGGGPGKVTGTRSNTPVQLEGSDMVTVLFRSANNTIEKVQTYSMSCPLDAGGLPVVWITGVPADASLAYLERLVGTASSDHVLDGAILAISQHDTPKADSILARLAGSGQPEKTREKAVFWMGAARGAAGLKTLSALVSNDPSEHIRDKAVFAISINHDPAAVNTLISTARNDKSSHVRGQAIFWLAQKAGKQAESAITDAIENDPDTGVKEKAVFALSQLPKEEGVTKLIDVARNNKNPKVKKQAFFWLGQSGDPRALAFLEQVLTR